MAKISQEKQEDSVDSASTIRLQTATKSAAYNIVLQITLRIVTFVANAFILRFISKDILGVINVRLLLLYTTIQFISREPFRRTCAPNSGETKESKHKIWNDILNITYLTIPIAVVIGLFFSSLWYFAFERPDEEAVPYYQFGIVSIYISVIIELIAEPFFIYGQRYDYIRLKVAIEGIFQLTRCLLHCFSVYHWPHNAIVGFAFAQIVASTIYSLCYISYFVFVIRIPFGNFIPTYFKSSSSNYFSPILVQTSYSFLKNTALKQFLTEGERYLMTMFSVVDFAEQGVFDVINNLGSLPARLVFQQIEESGYLLFSSLINRDIPPKEQRKRIIQSLYICSNLVKLMLLVALVLFLYGYHCTEMALFLYGGRGLISGPYGSLAVNLFKCHCLYIVFIALNGILESYSFAAMSVEKLDQFNYKMLAISVAFTGFSLLITASIGSVGFIIANCFNMLCRILISLSFIGSIIPEVSIWQFVADSLPSRKSMSSFLLVAILLSLSKSYTLSPLLSTLEFKLLPAFLYISTVGILCLGQLFLLYKFEKDVVHFARNQFLSKNKAE